MESLSRNLPPGAQARWRDYGGLALVGALLLTFNVVPLVGGTVVTLSCDRTAGVCRIDTKNIVKASSQTITLADISQVRAQWFKRKVDSQVTVDDIEVIVMTKGGARVLPVQGENDDRVKFAAAADTFLHTPTAGTVALEYGKLHHSLKNDFGIPLVTGLVFLAIAFLSPSVRIIGDRAAGKLIFERRPFGPVFVKRTDYPLASVVKAEVKGHGPGSGKHSTVLLVLSDGRHIQPGGWAATGGGAASRLRHRINDVLAAARA